MVNYTRRAKTFFFTFLALGIVLDAMDLPSSRASTSLAGVGMICSLVFWLIADANQRRIAIPYMSLWICHVFWFVVAPAHYFSTRGLRGLPKLGMYALLGLAVGVGSSMAGDELGSMLRGRVMAGDRVAAAQYGFEPRVLAMARNLGSDIRAFELRSEGVTQLHLTGFVITTDGEEYNVLQQLRSVLAPGSVAVVVDHAEASPFEGRAAAVAVVHAQDVFDVIRASGTNGESHGLSTEAIIERLRRLHDTLGIEIHGVGPDWLSIELQTLPSDVQAFAAEVHAWCPGSVDEAGGSVDDLATSLAEDRSLWLRWGSQR